VLPASVNRRDVSAKVERASASDGTKSIPAERQKESDLLYIILSDVLSARKADTALKRNRQNRGKTALPVSSASFNSLKIKLANFGFTSIYSFEEEIF
jgi:hypothetical protein